MRGLDLLAPDVPAPVTSVRWATVTQASPLRIKLDGTDTALGFTPQTLVGGLVADDRVRVEITGRRLVVLGKAGGGVEQTYTPALTAVTTDPTLGTGSTANGVYIVDPITGMVDLYVRIIYGTSGINAGSGGYRVDLPHPLDTTFHPGSGGHGAASILGAGWVRDQSATATVGTFLVFASSAAGGTGGVGQVAFVLNEDHTDVASNNPLVWAVSDQIVFTCRYRAA